MKKIVVIGPESTGKSTLSADLAKAFNTVWVPEFARDYLIAQDGFYEEEDLLTIAKGQLALEEEAGVNAKDILVCDTDLYVLKVWSEHKYGRCDNWILEQIAQRKYDLYLLTYIDVTWEDDPLREHPDEEMRNHFYNVYRDIVMNSGVPWIDVRGTETERLSAASLAIKNMFKVH
ncbi:ATPase [Taibaiella soli]|uniref:ATPase n=1 Tax=Taibaiella soli TaxID=1649169 RepID=A0A2W2B245_9BACT|nr:ATPase [Taibaiella soli]